MPRRADHRTAGRTPAGPARPTRGALRTGVACAVLTGLATAAAAPVAAAYSVDRVQGADRYQTAVAVSQRAFGGQGVAGGTVVLASGEGFADALSGAPAAASLGAPLLLTARGALPAGVRAEVQRLAPLDAVVLGGPGAVSDAVVTELESLGVSVARASGANRYDTSALVALALVAPEEGPPEEVLIASGEGFADGLAGGAYGAATGSPLLLSARDALPAETADALEALAPRSITVLGGPAAISPAVEAALDAYTTGAVTRVQGADRYATAAAVSDRMPAAARGATPLLAAGRSFPDALAGAALGQPLLLSERDCMPQATAAALTALGAESLTALGGPVVLSDAAASGAVCGGADPGGGPGGGPAPERPASDLDCGDFASQADAQATLDRYAPHYGDVHGLDADGDGTACESYFA